MEQRATVICAVDFSEGSGEAVARAGDLAIDLDAQVELLHSCALPAPGLATYAIAASPGVVTRVRESAMAQLERHRATLRSRGIEAHACIREGRPEEAIVRRAHETHADLIVMGHHGGSAWKRFIGGGTTREVMRRAPAPVLSIQLEDN